jgi:4-amino-4-deoxy-L-arabinose transferase-like glycosyltransferase
MYQTLFDKIAREPMDLALVRDGSLAQPAQLHDSIRDRFQFLSALLAHRWAGPTLLLALAVAARCIWYGDPVIQIDEQFYLLMGDRILHGAIPYVDVWDRKPVGLFLIYAGIRLFGGAGIYQYQIVATLFAWGTGLIVRQLAGRVASPRAGWIAGAIYILWLDFFTGQGGQSPVFYNLFMAGAGLLTLEAVGHDTNPARRFWLGAAAMALCGLALQIKYTALFEGIFFGLTLLWRQWRATGKLGATAASALAWIAIALIPTAAALLFYLAIGQGPAFVYVNFVSIFVRGNAPGLELLGRLGMILGLMSPLLIALLVAQRRRLRREREVQARFFLLQWFGAAAAGLLVFGTYYDHYALPLLVSLCAVIAPAFDATSGKRRTGLYLAGVLAAMGVIAMGVSYQIITHRKGNAAYAEQVTSIIDRARQGGSLYIYDGEPILYLMTKAPTLTKFLFPYHLSQAIESPSIGVDSVAEVKRILATHPAVIVDGVYQPQWRQPERLEGWHQFFNGQTQAIVDQALARDYRLVAKVPRKKYFRRIWQYKGLKPVGPDSPSA